MVTVLVGTTKGVFLLEADAARADWRVRGPFCDGWPINHAVGDAGTGVIWAAGGSDWHGAGVWRSTDGGESWTCTQLSSGQLEDWIGNDPETAQSFGFSPSPPAPFGREIVALWSLCRSNGTLFAGAKPAALYRSADDGDTWEKVPGLTDHPSAADWAPGAAGLVLHSIVAPDEAPGKIWVGISAAGVFASEDGGCSWERRNRRTNAASESASDPGNEVGHCVHNLVRAAGPPDVGDLLYQQNHHGVFRSGDGGRNWHEITLGLPSDFGFPIAVHPENPRRIWVLPLNGDSLGRYPPDARAAVWTSADGGETWEAERDGLPAENCFFTVLRQAMATDRERPAGVYFGTNSGSVFARSGDGRWREIARHLPTVLSVETLSRG